MLFIWNMGRDSIAWDQSYVLLNNDLLIYRSVYFQQFAVMMRGKFFEGKKQKGKAYAWSLFCVYQHKHYYTYTVRFDCLSDPMLRIWKGSKTVEGIFKFVKTENSAYTFAIILKNTI